MRQPAVPARAAAALAACGTTGTATPAQRRATRPPRTCPTPTRSSTGRTGREYIDVDDKTKKHPTLDAFTQQTGIKVNYTEDINDNDEFFAKIKPQLSAGQDTGRDVWCSPTGWSPG